MIRKRMVALLLSTMMVVGALVGCSNQGDLGSKENASGVEKQEDDKKGESKEEEINWVEEISSTKNRSSSLEKYMRNPEEVKSERIICGIEAIDVKTGDNGEQIVFGQVIEPYQFEYSYNEYIDENVKHVFIKYNPSDFDGTRVLKNDILAFAGLYSEIYSDTISGERVEAPMFEADLRLSLGDYISTLAMEKFMSSIGQSANGIGLKFLDEKDAVLSELLQKEEYAYLNKEDITTYYKDNNEIYWLLQLQDAAQAFDNGIGIYVANKDSEGNYKIEYKNTVELKGLDF